MVQQNSTQCETTVNVCQNNNLPALFPTFWRHTYISHSMWRYSPVSVPRQVPIIDLNGGNIRLKINYIVTQSLITTLLILFIFKKSLSTLLNWVAPNFSTNNFQVDIHLGISGDKVEIDPRQQPSSAKFWSKQVYFMSLCLLKKKVFFCKT